MANEKVYIHELVDIIGSNRAKYMHHMSAVWAAVRRDHGSCNWRVGRGRYHGQLALAVNMWEHDGWEGLAFHLGYEASGKKPDQNSSLGKMEPKKPTGGTRPPIRTAVATDPGSDVVDALGRGTGGRRCAGGLYAHERIWTDRNRSSDYIKLAEDHGVAATRHTGSRSSASTTMR